MKFLKYSFLSIAVVVLISSCAVIRQGEVGVKRKLGKLDEKTMGPGASVFNPLTTTVIRLPRSYGQCGDSKQSALQRRIECSIHHFDPVSH